MIGLVLILVIGLRGLFDWIPESTQASDDEDSGDGKYGLIGIFALVGGFGGIWLILEFARLRIGYRAFGYMVHYLREAMTGHAWNRKSVIEKIEKDLKEEPYEKYSYFTTKDAKEETIELVSYMNENIKRESEQFAEKRISENCEKEKCSLWVKRQEQKRLHAIENKRFLEKMEIEIECAFPEKSHEYLTEQWVKEIIFEKLGVKAKQIKNMASLMDDLGADDDEVEDLIKTIKKDFVLTIPPKEAVKFRTVGDIVKYLQVNGEKIDISEERSLEIAAELVLLEEKIEEEKKKKTDEKNEGQDLVN